MLRSILKKIFELFIKKGGKFIKEDVQSLKQFGIIKGLSLSSKRIMKCHPWGGHGYDPVPKNMEEK